MLAGYLHNNNNNNNNNNMVARRDVCPQTNTSSAYICRDVGKVNMFSTNTHWLIKCMLGIFKNIDVEIILDLIRKSYIYANMHVRTHTRFTCLKIETKEEET